MKLKQYACKRLNCYSHFALMIVSRHILIMYATNLFLCVASLDGVINFFVACMFRIEHCVIGTYKHFEIIESGLG